MQKLKVSLIINKHIDEVFQAFLEPKNIPFWMTNVVNYEVTEGKMGEKGAIVRLHYSQNRQKMMLEDRLLIYCEKGKKYVSERASKTMIVQLETTFHPSRKIPPECVWFGREKAKHCY